MCIRDSTNALYLNNKKEAFDDNLTYNKLQEEVLKLPYELTLFTILRTMEYEFIFGDAPDSKKLNNLIGNEPPMFSGGNPLFEQIFNYYLVKEMRRIRSRDFILSGHLEKSFRLLLLLQQFQSIEAIDEKNPLIISAAGRLVGNIFGRFLGLQTLDEKEDSINTSIYQRTLDCLDKYIPIKNKM